jgi:glycosyltransferase involved in cell wall biosynthesis
MRVLMLPDYRAGNPYQALLSEALARRGVSLSWGGHGGLATTRAWLRCGRPEIVHLHWTHPLWLDRRPYAARPAAVRLLLELRLLRRLGARLVWTVHNLHDHEATDPALEHAVNRRIARLCAGIVVHCAAAKDSVAATYRLPPQVVGRIRVVPHGHFIGVYDDHVTRSGARRALGLKDGGCVYLYFGRIRRYKGVLSLLAAFRALPNADARLLIVGQPSDQGLAAQVADRCCADDRIQLHAAYVPDGAIPTYFSAADVTVFPFRSIMTSSTVVLAMSLGRAVIVPRLGCLPELLDEEGAIFLEPGAATTPPEAVRQTEAVRQAEAVRQTEAMRQALSIARSRDLQRMGTHNRRRIAHLDWDGVAEKTLDLYRQALSP